MVEPATLLTIAGMVLNIMVLPTLIDRNAAVPKFQSIPSALALKTMTGAYLMLGMNWPALATGIGSILWLGVAKYRST